MYYDHVHNDILIIFIYTDKTWQGPFCTRPLRFGLGPSKVSYNSLAGYTIFEHFMCKISCLATKIVILGA